MSRRPRFRPLVRLVTRYLATQASIARSLERLADVAEGKVPAPVPLAEAPKDTRLHVTSDREFGAAYAVEERLRATLGREPTEEEVLRELDEVPWREELPDGGVPH